MEKELLDNDVLRSSERGKPYLLLLSSVFVVVGFFLSDIVAFFNVRTIIFSGPIIGLASLLVLIVSLVKKNKRGIIFGSISAFMVLILFLAIFLLDISPSEAQGLLPYTAAVCWIPIVVFGVFLWIEIYKSWKWS